MADDDIYNFNCVGPKIHSFSWDVPEDKRSILACLVAGVYALQHDREKKYTDNRALAPAWYSPFNYELVDLVLSTKNKTRINGAVFRWKYGLLRPAAAPEVILAFRGTSSIMSDYIVDYKIATQELHKTSRFLAAYNAVKNAVNWHGKENVCVTGHSLGAALAMSAARMMATEGIFLDAHLFNPPFSSSTAPLKLLFGRETYVGLQEMYTVTKAGLVNLLVDPIKRQQSESSFCALGKWYPNLYVHKEDPICSGFLEHFNNYEYMLTGKNGKLVMPHESIRGVLFSSRLQPHHLIPSAKLHYPGDQTKVTRQHAHSLAQWWSRELDVKSQYVNLTGREAFDQLPFFAH